MACFNEVKSVDDATQNMFELYCSLMEDKRELLPYYMSEDITLNWFGKTVKKKQEVITFLLRELVDVKHIMKLTEDKRRPFQSDDEVKVLTNVGNECGLEYQKAHLDNIHYLANLDIEANERPRLLDMSCEETDRMMTMVMEETELTIGSRQGLKFDSMGQCKEVPPCHRYFEANGSLSFVKTRQSPTSSKNLKLMAATRRWERRCKLYVEYEISPVCSHEKDFEIFQIIYTDNLRCRRNLALEFDNLME